MGHSSSSQLSQKGKRKSSKRYRKRHKTYIPVPWYAKPLFFIILFLIVMGIGVLIML